MNWDPPVLSPIAFIALIVVVCALIIVWPPFFLIGLVALLIFLATRK